MISNSVFPKDDQTCVSLASEPLFVKKALAILVAVNISKSSVAKSCIQKEIDMRTYSNLVIFSF